MKLQEMLVFEVAGRNFGVPLAIVEEVVPASQITAIPSSPPFLLGLSAVRGKVMGVIDAALRYNIGPALSSHFLVCRVRGNLTAITIDRPVMAGEVPLRALTNEEIVALYHKSGVDKKFLKAAYELLEPGAEGEGPKATGKHFFEINADLFVSAEMASKTGEA
jgi:chemotaxis signal transduction protein